MKKIDESIFFICERKWLFKSCRQVCEANLGNARRANCLRHTETRFIMKNILQNKKSFAVFALVLSAFLGAVMGVWVRIMSKQFDNFQQIAVRAMIGCILGLAIYSFSKKVSIYKLFKLSKLDFFYIFLRTLLLLVGIGLFTFAINSGSFSNVNMIYALPTTAILGIFILKEKLTFIKLVALIMGFVGAILISVKNFGALNTVGIGEVAALLSTFFYSGSYIIRKLMSNSINNEEIAVIGSFFMGVFALITSILLGNEISNFFTFNWQLAITMIMAGLTFIFIGIFNNYGFENIEAIKANNLLILTSLFGLIIGIIVYRETPTIMNLIGGVIIALSAIIINYSTKK
jgi:drug/metabolite transporter (DMT)-like permease